MEDLKQQQLEALEVASNYCKKLITGIENIINELTSQKHSDTDEYLKHIISGINWTIEIFNGTKELINQDLIVIDKEIVNNSVVALNDAVIANDDQKIASCLSDLLIFIKNFQEAADNICE